MLEDNTVESKLATDDFALSGMPKHVKKRTSKTPAPLEEAYVALPSFGEVYFNLLIGEFHSLRSLCSDSRATILAEEIVNKASAGSVMTWGDAYALDDAIAQMLPLEYLHQRAWCLENRYRDAVGKADAYDAFMKAEAPHLLNETEDHLRARVHNMIRELYRLYTVISCREDMREKLSSEARWTLLCILGAVAVFSVLAYFFVHSFTNIWGIVFAAGATGGLLSLQRRLQNLPTSGESLSDLVELSGGMTIKLTPIIGGTFAVVLFLIFCSGLAIGPLFPKFSDTATASGFIDFAVTLRPQSNAEWGKLLVWSFIAGFAERFVPDTLDRLIAKSQDSKK